MFKQGAMVLIYFALVGCTAIDQPSLSSGSKINNVIILIGDGMGPQQVGLLLSYARQAPHNVLPGRRTALDKMLQQGKLGIVMTHPADSLVTDSAAAATQLASGKFSRSELLGVDSEGNRVENIVELAKQLGKGTGLVSDTRITHATPAAFAAHQTHRSHENDVAEELLTANPDVMLSGGLSYWIPASDTPKAAELDPALRQAIGDQSLKSKRKDAKNLLQTAQQQGYALAFDKQQMQQAQGKLLGLFAPSEMPDGIAETQTKQDQQRSIPTLREMSAKALQLLEQKPQGFFLMIEAGQIDWAGHRNDTGLMLHEMLRFNETLNYVLDWAEGRDDTLIIVTADHETGGFGFSYSAANIPKPYALPGNAFKNKGLYKPNFNYGNPAILDQLYAQKLSYHQLFKQFDSLPKDRQTPAELAALVNANSEFKVTESQAKIILTTEANPFYRADHPSLNLKEVPKMPVCGAFYPYQKENRENLLAQTVATAQNVVWASGTHTSTPVYVFTQGPAQLTSAFTKILHQTQIGRMAIEALR